MILQDCNMNNNQTTIEKIIAGHSNCYLLYNETHAILIDVGSHRSAGKIIKRLEGITELPQISLIIITHTHQDHVQGLHSVLQFTGTKVVVHKSEADTLKSGFTPMPQGTALIPKILSWLGRRIFKGMSHYTPVEPTFTFEDTFDLQPYGFAGYVLHTPGHTPEHISLLVTDRSRGEEPTLLLSGQTTFLVCGDE